MVENDEVENGKPLIICCTYVVPNKTKKPISVKYHLISYGSAATVEKHIRNMTGHGMSCRCN